MHWKIIKHIMYIPVKRKITYPNIQNKELGFFYTNWLWIWSHSNIPTLFLLPGSVMFVFICLFSDCVVGLNNQVKDSKWVTGFNCWYLINWRTSCNYLLRINMMNSVWFCVFSPFFSVQRTQTLWQQKTSLW